MRATTTTTASTPTSKTSTSKPPTSPTPLSKPASSIQTPNGTYRYTGGVASTSTAPQLRSAAIALERNYNAITDSTVHTSNEYLQTAAAIDSSLSSRPIIAATPTPTTTTELIGLSPAAYADIRATLTASTYTQKHTDLCLGTLADHLEPTCGEYGRLLRLVREKYALCYKDISRLQSDGLWSLETAGMSVNELRGNLNVQRESNELIKEELAQRIEEARVDMDNQVAAARLETATQKQSYEDKIAQLNKSLYTLQNVVKNISHDTSQVRAGDMSQSLLKLNQTTEEQAKELAELRPYRDNYKKLDVTLMIRENDLKLVRQENANVKLQLEQRAKLVATLIAKRKQGLTTEEYSLLGGEEDRADAMSSDTEEEEATSQEKAALPPTSHMCIMCHNRLDLVINVKNALINGPAKLPAEAYRLMLPKLDVQLHQPAELPLSYEDDEPSTPPPAAASKKASDDDDDSSEDEDEVMPYTDNPKTLAIKAMLSSPSCPPLLSSRAIDPVWVVRTMRSIINSKMIEDATLVQPYTITSSFVRRTRFPEFVHSWFTPPPDQIESTCKYAKNVNKKISTASKAYTRAVQKDIDSYQTLIDEANEHRWALYYGVKILAQRSPPMPEAGLFWNLLDETYAEDYTTFYFFALSTVKATCDVNNQWGSTNYPTPPPNHYQFLRRTESDEKASFPTEAGPEVGVITLLPRTMWVLHSDAIKVIKLVTTKTLQEEQVIILRALGTIAVTAQGRMANVTTNKILCVDLHMFLKMLCHTYRSDQVNRTVAIRLMFETAAAGRMEASELLYAQEKGYGRKLKRGGTGAAGSSFYASDTNKDDDDDEFSSKAAPALDVVQFRAVVESFSPLVSPNEVSQMFREAHYASKGNVTYEEFLKIADRNQFFSRTAEFPSNLLAATTAGSKFSLSFRHRIGAIVHMSSHMMAEKMDKIESALSIQARLVFSGARKELADILDFFSCNGCIDGLAPLSAYRRLLLMCLQIRSIHQENGLSSLVTDPATVSSNAVLEIEGLTQLIREYDPCQMKIKLDTFKKSFSMSKMIEFWRQKVSVRNGPPLVVLKLMRCGYLSGKGDIRGRRVNKSLDYILAVVSNVVTFKVGHDAMHKRNGEVVSNLNETMIAWMYRQFGISSIVERNIHDLFQGVRAGMDNVARLKCFAMMTGLPEGEASQALAGIREAKKMSGAKAGDNREANSRRLSEAAYLDTDSMDDTVFGGEEEGQWEESLKPAKLMQMKQCFTFYLTALHTVHATKRSVAELRRKNGMLGLEEAVREAVKTQQGQARPRGGSAPCDDAAGEEKKEAMEDGGQEAVRIPAVPQLFPEADASGQWIERVEVLRGVGEVLFEGVIGFDHAQGRSLDRYKEEFFNKVDAEAAEGVMEVDLFLWHCLQLWSMVVKGRILSIRKMTSWFGAQMGAQMLCKNLQTIESWSAFCTNKLNCKGKVFSKMLEVRDQLDICNDSFRKVVIGAEATFPMMIEHSKNINFTKLIDSFEVAVLPIVTLDLGGAQDLVEPLVLHSDELHHKKREKDAQRKREEMKKREAAEKTLTLAEKARMKSGAGSGVVVAEEVEDAVGEKEYFEGSSLVVVKDAWECYQGAVKKWLGDVDGAAELRGAFEDEIEKFGKIKEEVKELELLLGERGGEGGLGMKAHRVARGLSKKAWKLLRSVLGAVHVLSNGSSAGRGAITVEFLKDDWTVPGRKMDLVGKKRVETWVV